MDSRFQYRIRKRLYYGEGMSNLNSPSLPLTEASVEYFQDGFPGAEGLGQLDMPMAANVTRRNKVSPCSMVMSMLYAKRLRQRNKEYLQSMSSTDVFFISVMMASKYLYDEGIEEEVYNDEWADSVGQEVEDVNQMEMDFLKEMDWHLFVKPEEFDQALIAVERRLALKEGIKRGWFTYTELAVLLDWDPVYNLWNQVGLDCTKVVSLFSAVYVASLVSMMGSAALALQLSGPMATATLAVLSFPSSHLTGSLLPINFQFPFRSSSRQDFSVEHKANTSSLPTVELRLSESSKHLLDIEEMESVEREKADCNGVKVSGVNSHSGCGYRQEVGKKVNKKMVSRRDVSTEETMPEPCSDYEGGAVEENVRVPKEKRASVLSLWLLDSLLSQVWSVLGNRQPQPDNSNGSDYCGTLHCDSRDSNGQNGRMRCCDLWKRKHCVHKNLGKTHHSKCKRCQSRKTQTQSQQPQSELLSSSMDPLPSQGFLSGQPKDTYGNVFNCVRINKSEICPSLEGHTAAENEGKPQTSNQQACLQRLRPMECDNYGPTQELNPNMLSTNYGASTFCLEKMNSDNFVKNDDSDIFPHKMAANSDLLLPKSLMAEIPILDPVGFFTKNSAPVLST